MSDQQHHRKEDPRSVEELFSALLAEHIEDPIAWDIVSALHFRGTREVLDRAAKLCRSSCIIERQYGAWVLGQVGVPERTFPQECVDVLLNRLEVEDNSRVVWNILIAFSHLQDPRTIESALRFLCHADPEIRYGVVHVLSKFEDDQAINGLIELSEDADVQVRDWATAGLGWMKTDSQEIRDALARRLTDADHDTRLEAISGLAQRGDRRILPALAEELGSGDGERSMIEAALLVPDPILIPPLRTLQNNHWHDFDGTLMQAIQACSNAGSARLSEDPPIA